MRSAYFKFFFSKSLPIFEVGVLLRSVYFRDFTVIRAMTGLIYVCKNTKKNYLTLCETDSICPKFAKLLKIAWGPNFWRLCRYYNLQKLGPQAVHSLFTFEKCIHKNGSDSVHILSTACLVILCAFLKSKQTSYTTSLTLPRNLPNYRKSLVIRPKKFAYTGCTDSICLFWNW